MEGDLEERHIGRDKSNLRFALILTSIVFVAELVGGILTRSLALVADSAHMFLDAFAVGLSFFALYLSELPATHKRTFGWHRAEVLAALINGLLLSVVAVEIFIHGWRRMADPQEVIILPMMIIAGVGLVTNLIVARRLHSSDKHDINMRGVYLHVLGDLMASVAVLGGGVVMLVTGQMIVDAILGMGIACLVLYSAIRLLRDVFHVLIEGVPRHIRVQDVTSAIAEVPGVKSVHDIHVWTICSHILSLSCHVRFDADSKVTQDDVISQINSAVREKYCITHSTIQVDHVSPYLEPVISQDLSHDSDHVHHSHG